METARCGLAAGSFGIKQFGTVWGCFVLELSASAALNFGFLCAKFGTQELAVHAGDVGD